MENNYSEYEGLHSIIHPTPPQFFATKNTLIDDGATELIYVVSMLHPDHVAQLDRIEEKLDRLLELLSPSP
jgi:hypothetical protein